MTTPDESKIKTPADQSGFPLIGIGASAGGLEALRQFFGAMPPDTGAAIVIVQHLSPDHPSELPAILGQYTQMPVIKAADGQKIEPNTVYVIPPARVLTVHDGVLSVKKTNGSRPRRPIDAFFVSMAEQWGERVVAIVMSGYGDDGSQGVQAVREHGGITIAQGSDSTKPQAPAMPVNAIATGAVDLVMPIQDVPAWLAGQTQQKIDIGQPSDDPEDVSDQRIDTLCEILRTSVGFDFSNYKRKTLVRRVLRRMRVVGAESIEKYIDLCRYEPKEAQKLFQELLINVTQFFRDPTAFAAVADKVVPALFEGKGADADIRIWVPGCATGEEAYSLAILMLEHAQTLAAVPNIQIFATDIDERCLEKARAGRYSKEIAEQMTPARLQRYFHPEEGGYRLVGEVRELCIFSPHSLIKHPPYSRLDFISCRNLMIYFDNVLQDRVIPLFHYALRPGGFLFLGPSESISRHGELFAPTDKRHRIYRRRDTQSKLLPQLPSFVKDIQLRSRSLAHGPADTSISAIAEQSILLHDAPAHVVVNENLDVLHFSLRNGRFFEPPLGAPERNIVAMVRRGLRTELRAMLQLCINTGQPVHRSEIGFDVEDRLYHVDLIVRPLTQPDADSRLMLVVFRERGKAIPAESLPRIEYSEQDEAIAHLEADIRTTRELLQTTIEEYETSSEELRSTNEELLSMNEELQSTNEELETSKEELQSVNEELQTVNADINNKVDELDRANSDLRNLIETTQIATLFLHSDLRIRNFTPEATKIFRVINTDIGRPITDIVHLLDGVDLEAAIRRVPQGGEATEQEVRRTDGTIYIMRIIPYRDGAGRAAGTVLTFVDVSRLKAGERQRGLLVDELNHRVKNILTVVMSIATHMLRDDISLEQFRRSFTGRLRALSNANSLLADSHWAGTKLGDIVNAELAPHRDCQIEVRGGDILLQPSAALTIGLAVHELATNAAKYGALHHAGMKLKIEWMIEGIGQARKLVIRWMELDGAGIVQPTRTGFGSILLQQSLTYDLEAKMDMRYRPSGLVCTIDLPASRVLLEE